MDEIDSQELIHVSKPLRCVWVKGQNEVRMVISILSIGGGFHFSSIHRSPACLAILSREKPEVVSHKEITALTLNQVSQEF